MSRDECKRKAKFSGSRARQTRTRSNDDGRTNIGIDENAEQPKGEGLAGSKPRVFVGAENGLLREALSRMSVKGGNIEVAGGVQGGTLSNGRFAEGRSGHFATVPLLPLRNTTSCSAAIPGVSH